MFFLAVLTACVSIGLSSCLDNNNGTDSDYNAYVTVMEDYVGRAYLASDDGLSFYPINSTVLYNLQLNDGTYWKRAYVGVKFTEDYVAGKTSYDISDVVVYYAIPYANFNERPDTLSGDYAFTSLDRNMWVKNGFVNVEFDLKVSGQNSQTFLNDIHMYVTKASNDTLYTKLRYVKENTYGQDYSFFMSFGLPVFNQWYGQLVPQNDSIIVKVEAEGNYESLSAISKCSYSEFRY